RILVMANVCEDLISARASRDLCWTESCHDAGGGWRHCWGVCRCQRGPGLPSAVRSGTDADAARLCGLAFSHLSRCRVLWLYPMVRASHHSLARLNTARRPEDWFCVSGTIEILDAGKVYEARGENIPAVASVTLIVRAGEFVSLVGASGCGKSTL